jgi:heme/copper-type cytochrome/quinol oxidase subunit 2
LIAYFFLILNNISIITLIPIPVILILNVIFFKLSKRENLEEYKNCLKNIEDVVELKK